MPGHCEGCKGMDRYASDMSRTAPCESGGSVHMSLHVFTKVPQKQGYSEESMCEFTEEIVAPIDGT